MVEENKLTSNIWLGIFKIDTNLSVEQVKSKFSDVTSYKKSSISFMKKEVYEKPDKFIYSGHIKKNKLYLYNHNSNFIDYFPSFLRGTIISVNKKTKINIWVRPNRFIITLVIILLLLNLKQLVVTDFSSDYQETLYYMLGLIVFIYCFYLIEVKIHLRTLKKLFKIDIPK